MISPAKVKARRKRAKEMHRLWAEEGKTYAEIGTIYGCTKQYVGQIIKLYQLAL